MRTKVHFERIPRVPRKTWKKEERPDGFRPKTFCAISPGGLDHSLSTTKLAAYCRQGGRALRGAGLAQNDWASVSRRHLLNARCEESTEHYGCQNRDLRYHVCFRHCRAPLGPGGFLLGLPVASALVQSTRRSKRSSLCQISQREESR